MASVPIIATGKVYANYIAAARSNLDALLRLTQGLGDKEFEAEAQRMIDCLDSSSQDARLLIELACVNERRDAA